MEISEITRGYIETDAKFKKRIDDKLNELKSNGFNIIKTEYDITGNIITINYENNNNTSDEQLVGVNTFSYTTASYTPASSLASNTLTYLDKSWKINSLGYLEWDLRVKINQDLFIRDSIHYYIE